MIKLHLVMVSFNFAEECKALDNVGDVGYFNYNQIGVKSNSIGWYRFHT